jgi:integrase
MATFRVVPDKRYSRKNNEHRICLITTVEGKVRYLPLKYEISKEQYDLAFKKKSMRSDCIDLREEFHAIETRAERIYNSMRRYDPERFKKLFYEDGNSVDDVDPEMPMTLQLSKLIQYYLDKSTLKYSTKIHVKVSLNLVDQYSPGIHIDEIDSKFLKGYETKMLNDGKSISTISSYMRNLRTIINYYRGLNVLPADYIYPFGKNGYSIKNVRKRKHVLSADEILRVIELEEFDSPKQEFARNIWLILYYGNGINPIDLLRLRWNQINNNSITLIRTKTETTRVYDMQEILIPLTDELKYYLDKVGVPTSPFLLGKLKDGYTQKSLYNRKGRFRDEINSELKKIREKLNLSVPFLMSTARDCYAMTLKRNGVSREFTSDSLGHSDIRTTAHYLDSLSIDESFAVNNNLVKRKNRKVS